MDTSGEIAHDKLYKAIQIEKSKTTNANDH